MSFNRLEAFIFEKMAETHLAGVSAAIVRDGQVIWSRGFGLRDVAHGLPATPDTLYGIASLTKSFTSAAILQLAEQGKLSLQDPVEKFIPEFTLRPGGESVRLEHFLSHTSGIPALAYMEAVIGHITGDTPTWLPISGASDLLTFFNGAEDWTVGKPGSAYHYLNEGFAMCGLVIERVSGQSYPDYIRDHILRPLGMARSAFDRATIEADPDAAVPYLHTSDGDRLPSTYAYGTIPADGGLISCAAELIRYVAMHLGNGTLDGVQILKPESLAEMYRPRAETMWRNADFGQPVYGLGMGSVPNFLGRRLIQHGGNVGTATSHLAFVPGDGVGIVVMTNGSGYAMQNLAHYGLAEALGEDPEALPFVKRDRHMKALEGVYETFRGTMRVEVRFDGGMVSLTETTRYNVNTARAVLDSVDDQGGTFLLHDGPATLPITFRRDGDRVEMINERYLLRKVGKLP